jgi:hypothetical protein
VKAPIIKATLNVLAAAAGSIDRGPSTVAEVHEHLTDDIAYKLSNDERARVARRG